MTTRFFTTRVVASALLCTVASARASAQSIRLSAKPVLTIGAEDQGDGYVFDRITGALRTDDGTIWVGNTGTAELRLFDSNGKYLKSASRAGAGPGEFEKGSAIRPFLLGASSIIATSSTMTSVNHYAATGDKRQQLTINSSPPAVQSIVEGAERNVILARATSNPRLEAAPGSRIATRYRYALYDTTGRLRASLFELPTAERIVHAFGGSTRHPFIPFSPNPVLAAGAGRVFLIRGSAPEVEVWSFDGKQTGRIVWNTPRTKSREIWAKWRETELASMTRPFDKAFYGDFFNDRLPLPEYVPVAEKLFVDPVGRLWVVKTRQSWDRTTICDVIDQSGRLLARLELPPRFTVLHVGKDFVLGKARTEDDVEQVQLYRVEATR